jgi:hypothetical protein
LSNNYTPGGGSPGSNNSSGSRRDREGRLQNAQAFNGTGALPALNSGRSYTGGFDFEEMLSSLRELFAHDRQMASQPDNRRCGICYFHFTPNELHYREEEGFYVCSTCERSLGKQTLPMVRRQQK